MELGIIEVVVNCKKNPLIGVAKVVCVILAVLLLLGGLSLMGIFGLWALVPIVLGVAAVIGAYLANLNSNVDYEYSLVDRELRVAKILNKEKRKAVGQYDLDKLEILAPMNSHRLDSYRNRQGLKEMDFSTRDSEKAALSCSAWLSRSAATQAGSHPPSASTRISLGPAIMSMPTLPKTFRLAVAT